MKKQITIFLASALLVIGACKKEEPEVTYPNHCVADSFECRKGTWVNISTNVPAPDTLEFYSETKFSNFLGILMTM